MTTALIWAVVAWAVVCVGWCIGCAILSWTDDSDAGARKATNNICETSAENTQDGEWFV